MKNEMTKPAKRPHRLFDREIVQEEPERNIT